jgi:hypothetical protein
VSTEQTPGVLEAGVFLAELAMRAAQVYVGVVLPGSTLGRVVLVVGAELRRGSVG